MLITFKHSGNFNNTDRFLKKAMQKTYMRSLEKYAQEGLQALRDATPVESSSTANSWTYQISTTGGGFRIDYSNSNVNKGVNIAVILQTGHGTGTGGYVAGRDYINPAIQPVFDKIADEAWREVTG